MTNTYSDLAVCTEDFTLTGTYKGKKYRCSCQPKDEQWRQREWAGYDITAEIELCHLCVRAAIRSGSRWTWYACDACRTVDNQVANAIIGESDPRNRVLPLGRHSLMNGVSLGADKVRNDEVRGRFIESLVQLSGLWDRIFAWKNEEARRLLKTSILRDLGSIPLDRWLDASPPSPEASVDAWCRFVDKDLPYLPELDDLRRARRAHVERSSS